MFFAPPSIELSESLRLDNILSRLSRAGSGLLAWPDVPSAGTLLAAGLAVAVENVLLLQVFESPVLLKRSFGSHCCRIPL